MFDQISSTDNKYLSLTRRIVGQASITLWWDVKNFLKSLGD